MEQETSAVRAFTRFYTRKYGVLDEGLLDTPYSLTESRLIFELGQGDRFDLSQMRQELGVNAGYVSRIVTRFESDGLIERSRSEQDGRKQVIWLTPRGRDVYETLNRRSAEMVEGWLSDLSPSDRQTLVGSMETIQRLLGPDTPNPNRMVVVRYPRPGDYGWVIQRHGEIYRDEYGWDITFEALVAGIIADFAQSHDPKREGAWIAEVDGERAGCVFCVSKDEQTAQLRTLLVEPEARGLGIGSLLVNECIGFARDAGYTRMVLWTNDILDSARRIYQGVGFRLVEEEQHESFGHPLVGQYWELDLS